MYQTKIEKNFVTDVFPRDGCTQMTAPVTCLTDARRAPSTFMSDKPS